MKSIRTVLAVLVVGALCGVAAAPAGAMGPGSGSANPIVQACEHNGYQITGSPSLSALKAALNSMGEVTQNYDACAQVIENRIAQLEDKQLKNQTGGGSSFPWVIVIIIVIVVIGGGGAFYSYRRSQALNDGDPQDSEPHDGA